MTEKFMLLMMESMKEMHKNYINNKEEAGMVKGVEHQTCQLYHSGAHHKDLYSLAIGFSCWSLWLQTYLRRLKRGGGW